jgi:hypothetical protein
MSLFDTIESWLFGRSTWAKTRLHDPFCIAGFYTPTSLDNRNQPSVGKCEIALGVRTPFKGDIAERDRWSEL